MTLDYDFLYHLGGGGGFGTKPYEIKFSKNWTIFIGFYVRQDFHLRFYSNFKGCKDTLQLEF